ncbi:sodium/mannose cotransporter SLC5A10-like [Amphiura filiformis]|uniref:sodium/mannose cotransporter SLC5A10-like n=1 Tax=Amphiura filiformis TaxID=82378 RepID=UPI003B2196B0
MQDDINHLQDWADRWQMRYNADKCAVMHFGHLNQHHTYKMGKTAERNIRREGFIGVLISNTLKVCSQCATTAKIENWVSSKGTFHYGSYHIIMVELGRLSQTDLAVIGCYLIVILLVGLASMLRKNRAGAEGYFLAGKTVPWYQVGASVFASNIGSHHFVGLAGTGAASGYAIVLFEWLSIWCIMAMAYIFLPVYLSSAVFTMPEYLGRRFESNQIRNYFSVLSLVFLTIMNIPVDLFSGAVFLQTILKWNLIPAVLLLLAITSVYTIAGGLAAVVYTETLQTAIIVGGGVVVTILGFQEIGGYDQLGEKFLNAISNDSLMSNNSCGIPPSDSMHLYRGVHDDLPTLGMCTGLMVMGLNYWAATQITVQRSLATKNLAHGQGGLVLTTWLKLTPMFLMVMPGMISRILNPDKIGCSDPAICTEICQNPNGCTNIAYPLLVITVLPAGLKGLLVAVMLSALMSSLASAFNSASTIFTLDLWVKIRKIPLDWRMNKLTAEQKRRNEFEVMLVGRLVMVFLMVFGSLWTPIIQQGGNNGQIFTYMAAIGGALASPLIANFLLGLFWHRTSEAGAFWSLMLGLCLAVFRIIMEIFFPNPRCGEPDTRPTFIQAVMFNYLYYAALNFVITIFVALLISCCTKPVPESCLHRLTYWTRYSKEPRHSEVIPTDISEISPSVEEPANTAAENAESSQEAPLVQDRKDEGDDDAGPSVMPQANGRKEENIEDGFLLDNDSEEEINDTEQLIPTSDLKPSSTKHRFKIYEGSEESLNFKKPEKHVKLKRVMHWFLGVSTFDGKPVAMETQEERELEMQKKLVVSSCSKVFIMFNWGLVITAHLFLYALYW